MITTEEAIVDRLPHRPPFRFVSSVISMMPGVSAEGRWRVVGDEPFFAGHFPAQPIVPGVLIGEALAQLSGLVAFASPDNAGPVEHPSETEAQPRPPAHLAHVDLRFRSGVLPPAEIRLHSRLARTFGALRQFEVEATVEQRIVARGMLTLAAASESGGAT